MSALWRQAAIIATSNIGNANYWYDRWTAIWRRSSWFDTSLVIQEPLFWACLDPWGAARDEACQWWCQVPPYPTHPQVRVHVDQSRLASLVKTLYPTANKSLVKAFLERWQHKTSFFHLSTEEMTITMDDVSCMLQFPMKGGSLIMSSWPLIETREGFVDDSPQHSNINNGSKCRC